MDRCVLRYGCGGDLKTDQFRLVADESCSTQGLWFSVTSSK